MGGVASWWCWVPALVVLRALDRTGNPVIVRMTPAGKQLGWVRIDNGPVAVPTKASELAEQGWSVTVVLGRSGDRWQLLAAP